MSDLFWIIPSFVLGATATWLIMEFIIYLFKNNELRDIVAGTVLVANVLSLISLGWWLANYSSSQGLQVVGVILMVLLVFMILFMLVDYDG